MSWKANMDLATSMIGCELRSLDGDTFIGKEAGVRYDKPAIVGEGIFADPTQVTLLKMANGETPSMLNADPIMMQVFAIIIARGDVEKTQLEQWVNSDEDGDHDPIFLYEQHIAPAVNAIEDAILAERCEVESGREPSGLLLRYLYRADGDRVQAAEWLGQDLMRGDPAQHKAGYTLPNAILAVKDAFEMMAEGVSDLTTEEIDKVQANLRGWQDAREERDAEEIAGLRPEAPERREP